MRPYRMAGDPLPGVVGQGDPPPRRRHTSRLPSRCVESWGRGTDPAGSPDTLH